MSRKGRDARPACLHGNIHKALEIILQADGLANREYINIHFLKYVPFLSL